MFAIIKTGGKQYKVSPGSVIHVETLSGEAGSLIDIGDVTLVGGTDNIETGEKAGKTGVKARILRHFRGEKGSRL